MSYLTNTISYLTNIISYLLNINLQIANNLFSPKISLRVWAVIFEKKTPFSNLSFFLVFGRTLIPECVY